MAVTLVNTEILIKISSLLKKVQSISYATADHYLLLQQI